jgi:hypothetical protein
MFKIINDKEILQIHDRIFNKIWQQLIKQISTKIEYLIEDRLWRLQDQNITQIMIQVKESIK